MQFGNTALAQDVLASYRNATRMSPIPAARRNQILQGYGIQPGWAKGKSDTLISNEAARAVLARFQAERERAAQVAAEEKAAEESRKQAAAAEAERQRAAQEQARVVQQQAAARAQQEASARAAQQQAAIAPAAQHIPPSTGQGSVSGGTSGGISVDRAIQIKNEYGRPDIMLGGEGTTWRAQIMSSEATFRAWMESQIRAQPAPSSGQAQIAQQAVTSPAPSSAKTVGPITYTPPPPTVRSIGPITYYVPIRTVTTAPYRVPSSSVASVV